VGSVHRLGVVVFYGLFHLHWWSEGVFSSPDILCSFYVSQSGRGSNQPTFFLSVLGFPGCRRVSDKERRWLLIVGMWLKRTGMEELKSSLSRIQRLMLIESSTRQGKANGSISGRRVLSFSPFLFLPCGIKRRWVLGFGMGLGILDGFCRLRLSFALSTGQALCNYGH
jgi:hypothetical protein